MSKRKVLSFIMAVVLVMPTIFSTVGAAEVRPRNVQWNGFLKTYSPDRSFETPLFFSSTEVISSCQITSGPRGVLIKIEGTINATGLEGATYKIFTSASGTDVAVLSSRKSPTENYTDYMGEFYINNVKHKDYWKCNTNTIIHGPGY